MKNPNYPKRVIRHAKLLKEAGFKLDMAWMGFEKKNPSAPNSKLAKLVYWKNDAGIQVIAFDSEPMTIKTLVDKVIGQAIYNTKKQARVIFDKLDE